MTLVFHSGTVRTMDAASTVTDALAVRDGRIVALGTAATALLAEPDAEEVDLAGRTLLPGLIDVHNHHHQGGRHDLFDLQLLPTDPLETILTTVAERAADTPVGHWIYGGSAGSGLIDVIDTADTLRRLDQASTGHPVLLTDDSLHNRWANSAALAAAGIDDATADPEGGHISRDADGHATGWLVEAAGVLVEHVMAQRQPIPAEQVEASSVRGVEILNSYGITGFQDAAASQQIMRALERLDTAGRLNSWVVSSTPVEEFIFGYEPVGEQVIFSMDSTRTEHHRPDFIKIFLDGVPPARTAAFLEPYLPQDDHECSRGHLTMAPDQLEGWLLRTAEAGISAKIHCTGDASVRAVLDAVQAVRARGYDDVRYQVAHGQFVSPQDVPRFAELDVTADVSPALWYPGVIAEALAAVLGPERGTRIQPNRDLLAAGARVAAGSDWPVAVSPNPWEAIYGLITRQDPTGEFPGTLWPEQAMTAEEAVRAYTLAPAEAMGLADVTGSLELGKSADLVLLPLDPVTCPVRELITLAPEATWFAGRQVFAAAPDRASA